MLTAYYCDNFGDSSGSASSTECPNLRAVVEPDRLLKQAPVKSRTPPPRPKHKSTFTNFTEHYCIIVKPKLYRSSSMSDLTTTTDRNDLLLDYKNARKYFGCATASECAGDSASTTTQQRDGNVCADHMSFMRNIKPHKKTKRRADEPTMSSYATNFANEYIEQSEPISFEPTTSGFIDQRFENTDSNQKAAFPFKSTPSGNLKVQSNQVVFQSPTVGVLLADPTQAQVKVKFEGKASLEPHLNQNTSTAYNTELVYGSRDVRTYVVERAELQHVNSPPVRDDRAKDLASLGYSMSEPVDWSRVQLPKKSDLYQEFYRRIHNFINTDIVVQIGSDQFHCHLIVLQAYSAFFDKMSDREVELPVSNVSPQAFQTIYDWMIFCGSDSHKLLRRDNILDVFCAAQYLDIKDLEGQCWSFIVNEDLFTEDTAFALFQEARLKGITPVMELMIPRVMRFFLPLVASRDFLQLSADEVMVFLRSNYICVTSEIEVMMSAVRWLYGDWPNRRKLVQEVMRCVRFGLISPWQLVDVKRNRDNPEVLEVIQEPEVQHMVDDGLAYVIIKYWYGNNSKNYYHWIDVLGLVEPAERNWIGEEKNHTSYKEFLKYLEQFLVPRDQAYQQLAMQQPARRNEDIVPGSMRSGLQDPDKLDMRRPKLDFPLPATLKGLTDKDKSLPTMSEFFESRKKAHEASSMQTRFPPVHTNLQSEVEINTNNVLQVQQALQDKVQRRPGSVERHRLQNRALHEQQDLQQQIVQQKLHLQQLQQQHMQMQLSSVSGSQDIEVVPARSDISRNTTTYEPAEKDEDEEKRSTNSETSTDDNVHSGKESHGVNYQHREKRHSVAASYLASATAALASAAGSSRLSQNPQPGVQRPAGDAVQQMSSSHTVRPSPQISMFNPSKENIAKLNMNKLSNSILGPSNKNYIADGSLFNWDRETVLVFGGIDPHTAYGVGRNTGRDIYRFDPVANVWEYVGDLPEPRHHHSVAFLRGRVYLVGGADPRNDDVRGKSIVVSTVWSYEPVTKSWFSETGLTTPRKNFGLVVHRMALYAIGGQDKKGRVINSVERFDPKAGTWTEVRPMSVARMGVACTKYREYIWVAGGMTGDKKKPICRTVECYNSKTNEWTEINSLRFPLCFATLFSMNDRLYLLGGAGRTIEKEKTTSSVSYIDVWDWKDREWKLKTEMSIPRHGHALAYLGTQLIIIGGVTTIYMHALSNVESFCCERMAWIRGVADLPCPLSGHGAVTLPPASLM